MFGSYGYVLLILIGLTFVTASDDFEPIQDINTYSSTGVNVTRSDMERLVRDKKTGYNRYMLPSHDYSKPVRVKVGMSLTTFRELDEVNEKFSMVGGLELQWIDDRMTWNVSEYGGIRAVHIEREEFWTPTLMLGNAYETFEKIAKDEYWAVRYLHTGHAIYITGDVFSATCSVDVTYYPFDVQTCSLFFVALSYTAGEVQLFPLRDKIHTGYFSAHGEWDVVDSEIVQLYFNLGIEFSITLERKPLFIVINVILSIILLSALNTLVFLIPVDAGERFSYGMTVLLAIAVFLTIISDNLPKSGENIPVLCYYLVSLLIYGIIIMFGTTLSVRIYFKPEEESVPNWCMRMVQVSCCKKPKSRPRITKMKSKYESNQTNGIQHRTQNGLDSKVNGNVIRRLEQQNAFEIRIQSIKAKNEEDFPEPNTPEVSVTWKDVSCVLDKIFFIVSWIILIVFTALFFAYVVNKHSR